MEKLIQSMKDVLDRNYSQMRDCLKNCLSQVVIDMFSKDLVTEAVKDNPTYDAMIGEIKTSLQYCRDVKKLREHCESFLSCITKQGGPAKKAAERLVEDWNELSTILKISI